MSTLLDTCQLELFSVLQNSLLQIVTKETVCIHITMRLYKSLTFSVISY